MPLGAPRVVYLAFYGAAWPQVQRPYTVVEKCDHLEYHPKEYKITDYTKNENENARIAIRQLF